MVHLVVPGTDEGDALTYFNFPIRDPAWKLGSEWNRLWKTARGLGKEELLRLGMKQPLYNKIRSEIVRREMPALYITIQLLADLWNDGTLEFKMDKVGCGGPKAEAYYNGRPMEPLNINAGIGELLADDFPKSIGVNPREVAGRFWAPCMAVD